MMFRLHACVQPASDVYRNAALCILRATEFLQICSKSLASYSVSAYVMSARVLVP